MPGAVVEAAVRHRDDARGIHVARRLFQRRGHLLGVLHEIGLHVDHPDADVDRRGHLGQQLELRQLAVGELEIELVAARPRERREQIAVVTPVARAALEVAEAQVHADARLHAVAGGVEHLDQLGSGGVAGRVARLVDLQVGGAGRDQRAHLGVDDGDHVGQHRIAADPAVGQQQRQRQRHRARHAHLDRPLRKPAQVRHLVDDAQPVRGPHRALDPVARVLVVAGGAEPACGAQRHQAGEAAVEALDEVAAPHLAVGDDVDPGALLIEQRYVDRVVERFGDVGLTQVPGGRGALLQGDQPARQRVAADQLRRVERSVGHGQPVSPPLP